MAIIQLKLEGAIPPKKNSRQLFVRGGKPCSVPNQKYRNWNKGSILELKSQFDRDIINCCRSIDITITFPDYRRRDLTNLAESIMDTLVDAEIIKDDCWSITGTVFLVPEYKKDVYKTKIIIRTKE